MSKGKCNMVAAVAAAAVGVGVGYVVPMSKGTCNMVRRGCCCC
jgi:hypothetical protein